MAQYSCWRRRPCALPRWSRADSRQRLLQLAPVPLVFLEAGARARACGRGHCQRRQEPVGSHIPKAALCGGGHARDRGHHRERRQGVLGHPRAGIWISPRRPDPHHLPRAVQTKAAIVTCGGLCPGLNSIIREVTNTLWTDYGIRDIVGLTGGYNGLSDPENNPPVELTKDSVSEIHMKGGSILKAGRGGLDLPKICDNLKTMGINILFVVGGDGTQYAGNMLYEACRERDLPVSVIGVPKSIDNDVLVFDKTFGFESAVVSASETVRNVWVEATSCQKGVGIVKLMGRDAGFVAMHAALASTIADVVLIPEVSFKMEDVLEHVERTLDRKGYCVVIVAEGAGQEHVSTGEKDATGHTVYGDIGTFLRDKVNEYFKDKGGRSFYIDPSYIIRSIPVRPIDHIYCSQLARGAAHVAMRGYTGVCVGALNRIEVIIPSTIIARGKRRIDTRSFEWQSCVTASGMPPSLAGFKD
ncbi:unnamed protein product [Prorocentrum cordatum]|uniref:Phosphofructokinase domain-containing protein n=1 Tax=Prorocentrum cordatum TaxID=2364126 RepID=A0ABN9Q7N3_9DINO|nr:unnamed protein product [Polarella glacialis]